MHTHPVHASDHWVLQEKVVYTFQKTQITRRLPHLKRQAQQQQQQPESAPSSLNKAPDVVLLSLWPQATSSQILQYSLSYRTLYPASRIVLLHNNASNFGKNNEQAINTALDDLTDQPRSKSSNNRVLLHLFGSSGASGACKLLRIYRLRTGMTLDVGAVIADTEPAPSITTLFKPNDEPGISSTLYTFFLAFWMTLQQYIYFWPSELHASEIHQDLNNPLLLPKEARKCFIFAQRGLMLTWMKQHSSSLSSKASFGSAAVGGPGGAGTGTSITGGSRGVDSCTSTSSEVYYNQEQHDERREYAIRRSSIDQKGRWSGDQERYWSGIEAVWDGR